MRFASIGLVLFTIVGVTFGVYLRAIGAGIPEKVNGSILGVDRAFVKEWEETTSPQELDRAIVDLSKTVAMFVDAGTVPVSPIIGDLVPTGTGVAKISTATWIGQTPSGSWIIDTNCSAVWDGKEWTYTKGCPRRWLVGGYGVGGAGGGE